MEEEKTKEERERVLFISSRGWRLRVISTKKPGAVTRSDSQKGAGTRNRRLQEVRGNFNVSLKKQGEAQLGGKGA